MVRTTKETKARRHAAKKAAKARKRAVKKAKAPRRPDDDFTIDEWCQRRRVTRPHFYELLRLGLAPRTMKLKKRRTISASADAEWQAEREREQAPAESLST